MSNGDEFGRQLKLWAKVSSMCVDGKRDPRKVNSLLQGVLDGGCRYLEIPRVSNHWMGVIHLPDEPFDPNLFVGGLSLGKKKVQISQTWTDHRSSLLSKVDLSTVALVSLLRYGEDLISGEEKLRRLKEEEERIVRLDFRLAQYFLRNQNRIPGEWKPFLIIFDGTVFTYRDDSPDFSVVIHWLKEEQKWVGQYALHAMLVNEETRSVVVSVPEK